MNLRKCDTVEQARATLSFVLDSGINLIDTARAYNGENGEGVLVESEALVGAAIRERTDLDEPIVVITKGHAYTPEDFQRELGISREKLGVTGTGELFIGQNRIVLVYLLHGINEERWNTVTSSGVLDSVQQAKSEGLINFIGFSSHYAQKPQIKAAMETGIFDVVELPYNLFNRELGEDGETDLLALAHSLDIGLINMKAFSGNGFVAIYRILRDYVSIDYAGMLRFCLANSYVSTIDAGAKYASEFLADMDVAQLDRLDTAAIAALKKEADSVAPVMKNICRECMHCTEKFECPQGVDFPAILSTYSRFLVGTRLGVDTREQQRAYQQFEKNAEDCIECAECLPWCEYKLDVPEMLKEAHAELG
jgi:hypothetical protein